MDKENKKNDYGYNSTFPTVLRKLMEERSVTQEELAKYCGTQRQTIGQWKDGNTKPDILSLKRIAEFFQVSADYLIGITDNPTANTELRAICETTGLTQEAVENLITLNNQGWIPELNIFSEMVLEMELWRSIINIHRAVVADRSVRDVDYSVKLSQSELEILQRKGINSEILDMLSGYTLRDIFKQEAIISITNAIQYVTDEIIFKDEDGDFNYRSSKTVNDLLKLYGCDDKED